MDARGLEIASVDRMRLDGTIIPRQGFVGDPVHRVDIRLQQRIRSVRASIAGLLECSICSTTTISAPTT